MDAPNDSLPTRWSLIRRLKDWNNQDNWKEFFNTYWKLIYNVARKHRLSDQEAQDIVQETVITVAKQMQTYRADPAFGSFKGWLYRITRNKIIDQLRKKKRHRERHVSTPEPEPYKTPTSPELRTDFDALWDQEWHDNLVGMALERIKTQISPEQYQIFHLSVIKERPNREVAQQLDVSIGKIYSVKYRVRKRLQKELQKLRDDLY